MQFLNATNPRAVRWMKTGLGDLGFRALNTAHGLARRFRLVSDPPPLPASTTGAPQLRSQVVELVRRPLRVELPKRNYRNALGLEDRRQIPIVRDPQTPEDAEAVFYFPGCGSERLFSDIGLATLALLSRAGVQTVLPPGYLCCGYPQNASGDSARGHAITTENRVLFHRVANTLNYLDIKTVVVSCGTCMDQLLQYQFEQIFPGCRLLDIHEFLMERGFALEGQGQGYLYHDPCHSPMKTYAPLKVAGTLLGSEVRLSERCCGEAGTLGTARPDIASQLRFRKSEELLAGKAAMQEQGNAPTKLLTSCPACLQGLSKYQDETGLKTDYILIELANQTLGSGWQERFIDQTKRGGIEQVLL
jgi:Fe-S oxidoreductase